MLRELETRATKIVHGSDDDITKVQANLSIFRQRQDAVFDGLVYHPLFCVVLRGRKEFQVEGRLVSVSPGEAFVISHDMPIASSIAGATPEAPYLATILSLDLGILRGLFDGLTPPPEEDPDAKLLTAGPFQLDWAEPLYRYLGLEGQPNKAHVLEPLILEEIHFQLLMSPMGGMLRNLLFVDSNASRVAKATKHINERFREPISIADLTKIACMSSSSFHESFKKVTGTTPLQYQKDLRLIEARNLLFTGGWSVSAAGLEVGYESLSHFSRDYTRKYGCSPKHHLPRAKLATGRS